MYYLAFFVNYHYLFQEKLKSWLKNRKTHTCISINDKKHNVTPTNSLLEPYGRYYDKLWYIHHKQNWYIHG